MGDQTHGPPPPSPPGSDAAGGGQALPRAGPPDGRAPKVVTVYASSSSGVADAYKKLAYSMGEQIAAAGWIQLNGGGCTGLMGAATAGGLARGGTVNAVILDIFTAANMHDALGSVEVVTDMGARKAGLYAPAAAFVALPGGLGTLEELAEVLSWRQLGFHTRPIVLVGAAFWRPLVSWVQQGVDEGFVAGGLGGGVNAFAVVDTAEEAIDYIRTHEAQPVDKAAMYAANFTPSTAAVVSTVPAPADGPPVTVHADWTVAAGAAVGAGAAAGGEAMAAAPPAAPPSS